MATVRVELVGLGTNPDGRDGANRPVALQHDVAAGDTLGRLLERLVHEFPSFAALLDPRSGPILSGPALLVNGRPYHLIGGLTYLLRDGDRLSLLPGPVVEAS